MRCVARQDGDAAPHLLAQGGFQLRPLSSRSGPAASDPLQTLTACRERTRLLFGHSPNLLMARQYGSVAPPIRRPQAGLAHIVIGVQAAEGVHLGGLRQASGGCHHMPPVGLQW